jgi:hypothetical protein
VRKAIVVLLSGFLLLLSSCGAVSSNMKSASTQSSDQTHQSSAQTQKQADGLFLATMYVLPGREPREIAPITISKSKDSLGHLQFTLGELGNLNLLLEFCSYPDGFDNCITLTSFTPDADGSADVNFTFPQKGTYAGTFSIWDTTFGVVDLIAASSTGSNGTSFFSDMLPAATITSGIQQVTGHAPGRGTIAVNGLTAHLTLTHTLPNHTFNTAVCFRLTSCITMADVPTDAYGNASIDIGQVQAAGFSNFLLSDSDGVEFVSAFRIR